MPHICHRLRFPWKKQPKGVAHDDIPMFEEIRHEDDVGHFRYVEPTSDRLRPLTVTASWPQALPGGWSVLRRWTLHWRLCLDSGNGTSRMSPGDPAD